MLDRYCPSKAIDQPCITQQVIRRLYGVFFTCKCVLSTEAHLGMKSPQVYQPVVLAQEGFTQRNQPAEAMAITPEKCA